MCAGNTCQTIWVISHDTLFDTALLACTAFSILKFVLFVVSLPEPTLRTFLSSTFNYLGYFGLFFLVQVTFNMLSSTEKDVNVNVKLQSNYKLLS